MFVPLFMRSCCQKYLITKDNCIFIWGKNFFGFFYIENSLQNFLKDLRVFVSLFLSSYSQKYLITKDNYILIWRNNFFFLNRKLFRKFSTTVRLFVTTVRSFVFVWLFVYLWALTVKKNIITKDNYIFIWRKNFIGLTLYRKLSSEFS